MRFACLLVEHLPTRAERLARPELQGQPVVILHPGNDHVLDASSEALAANVSPGDSRRRVEQHCPEAIVLTGREDVYQACHDVLRTVAEKFANQTETGDLGELYIEVGELARTFPNDKALGLMLVTQAQRATDLDPTVGIAANKFTAKQAAVAAANKKSRIVVVKANTEAQFLAPLPLTALPEPPLELLRRLYLFGISTLGGVAALPKAAFTVQFGAKLAHYYDLARGVDKRPLIPQAPPPTVSAWRDLPDPLTLRPLVLDVIDSLAGQIAGELVQAGYHALTISINVTTADGNNYTEGASLKPPTSDETTLRRIAGQLLTKLPIASGVSHVRLTTYPLREWHLDMRQTSMFDPPERQRTAQIQAALTRLRVRFGEWVVRQASDIGPPLPVSIRVTAGPNRAPKKLSWGNLEREVRQISNYWRERTGWWDVPIVRDYFEIESKDGLSFTVFRDQRGRWWLDRRRR